MIIGPIHLRVMGPQSEEMNGIEVSCSIESYTHVAVEQLVERVLNVTYQLEVPMSHWHPLIQFGLLCQYRLQDRYINVRANLFVEQPFLPFRPRTSLIH